MYEMMPLKDILEYEKDMKRLKVSQKARSRQGFLTAYKKGMLNGAWIKKRDAFIARTLAAYNQKRTLRRYLSLIAWAYSPLNPPDS
jgi:hypothetical protein